MKKVLNYYIQLINTIFIIGLLLTGCENSKENKFSTLTNMFVDEQIFSDDILQSSIASISQFKGEKRFDEIIKTEPTSSRDFEVMDQLPGFEKIVLYNSDGLVVTKILYSNQTEKGIIIKFAYDQSQNRINEYWFYNNILQVKKSITYQDDSTIVVRLFEPDQIMIFNNTENSEFFEEDPVYEHELTGKMIITLNDCNKPSLIHHFSYSKPTEEINPLTGEPYFSGETENKKRLYYDMNCNLIREEYLDGDVWLTQSEYYYKHDVLVESKEFHHWAKENESDSIPHISNKYEYFPNNEKWDKRVVKSERISTLSDENHLFNYGSPIEYYVLERKLAK